MTPVTFWQRTPLAGWVNCLRFAARGVRLHPSARIYGEAPALQIGRGSKIGRFCLFNLGAQATIRLGGNIWVHRDVEFQTEGQIDIGAGTSLQRAVLINGNVAIGRGCIFAPGVFVSSGKHVYDLRPAWPIRAQEALLKNVPSDSTVARYVVDRPVRIDEDCWLGAHVVVAPGVRIGRGAVVGANSVVTRDVEPYSIVAGAPARMISRRLDWDPPDMIDAADPNSRPYLYRGFDLEEQNGCLVATAVGEVSVAIKAKSSEVLEVRFLAHGRGALQAFGRSFSFDAGEQSLRLEVASLPAESFAQALFVSMHFAVDSPDAAIKFLGCRFDNS